MQFTVNGLFQPTIKSKAGPDRNLGALQRQRHRLPERCGSPRRRPAGIRRSPSSGRTEIQALRPLSRLRRGARGSSFPPASRYAIAVTMPATKAISILRNAAAGRRRQNAGARRAYSTPTTAPRNPPATLGTLERPAVRTSATSTDSSSSRRRFWRAPVPRADPAASPRRSSKANRSTRYTAFRGRLPNVTPGLHAHAHDLGRLPQRSRQTRPIPRPSSMPSKAVPSPIVPLIQPRLGSVEEWTFINRQQRRASDPRPRQRFPGDELLRSDHAASRPVPDMWGIDNANVPGSDVWARTRAVIETGNLSMRTRFEDYIGLFVHALPSPQPRRQRPDGAGQRDPGGLVLRCGGCRGSQGHAAQVKRL